MTQSSLDTFQEPEPVRYVTVLVLVDISIAWTDRDWHFHNQDIADIDTELAELMVKRGMARMLRGRF